MRTKPDPELIDDENPEWTAEDFARARPAREVLPPALYAALTDKSKPATITLVSRMGRPPLENPKEPIHIRLSAHVLKAFRATGRGWQTRIDAVLREAVAAGKV